MCANEDILVFVETVQNPRYRLCWSETERLATTDTWAVDYSAGPLALPAAFATEKNGELNGVRGKMRPSGHYDISA